jgi:DNA polymerase-3 subunit epsilon
MIREVALDTETTGLSHANGHRIIEIGCVELLDKKRTDNNFHVYINPQREVDAGAFKVHGISGEFLSDKPLFKEVAQGFLDFIANDKLVIHNAAFDLGFLNAELANQQLKPLKKERAIDTLLIARERFPGSPANLDALCKRFAVDISRRDKHGALLDAELLADVYFELFGGSQKGLDLGSADGDEDVSSVDLYAITRQMLVARDFPLSDEELSSHKKMLDKIDNAIWKKVS